MRGGRDGGPADVVFVEVGGTAGDYENGFYIEALRELAFEEGPESTCFVALTYIIEPQILGEQKSKAAQLGIKRLMEAGIQPSLVACRAKSPVTETVMEKIGMFSNVPMNRIFSMHDRESVYLIPEEMRKAGLDREILSMLQLHDRVDTVHEDAAREDWSSFSASLVAKRDHAITLGIPGKYVALRDAYASIDKAIEHAGIHFGCDIETRWIDTGEFEEPTIRARILGDLDAIIVPGGFGVRGRGGEDQAACSTPVSSGSPSSGSASASRSRSSSTPGTSWAWPTRTPRSSCRTRRRPIISELPDQKELEGIMGGTMRLGAQDVVAPPVVARELPQRGSDDHPRAVPAPVRGRAPVHRHDGGVGPRLQRPTPRNTRSCRSSSCPASSTPTSSGPSTTPN